MLLADTEYVPVDSGGSCAAARLPSSSLVAPRPLAAEAAPADVERDHIVRTLQQVRGNKAVAARLLGISRRAFYRQLERHGLHQRLPADSHLPASAHYDVEQV